MRKIAFLERERKKRCSSGFQRKEGKKKKKKSDLCQKFQSLYHWEAVVLDGESDNVEGIIFVEKTTNRIKTSKTVCFLKEKRIGYKLIRR